MSEPLTILLTNDDGFYADGLQTLYTFLKDSPELSVYIAAPDRERSAVGHGITMHHPLRASTVFLDSHPHWLVDGTPSDCVKLAVEYFLKDQPPGLLISGINRGPNLGNDILYSGTVSAAIEGSIAKIPSIAVSLASYGKASFAPAAGFIKEKLNQLKALAKHATLNLNFPVTPDQTGFSGVKLTKLGNRIYRNVFEERKDPRGRIYFWMGGEPVDFEQAPDSDIQTVAEGFISITPLHFDLTDYQLLKSDLFNSLFR